MKEFMAWHRSMDRDPMLRWLRGKVVDTIQRLDAPLVL